MKELRQYNNRYKRTLQAKENELQVCIDLKLLLFPHRKIWSSQSNAMVTVIALTLLMTATTLSSQKCTTEDTFLVFKLM